MNQNTTDVVAVLGVTIVSIIIYSVIPTINNNLPSHYQLSGRGMNILYMFLVISVVAIMPVIIFF